MTVRKRIILVSLAASLLAAVTCSVISVAGRAGAAEAPAAAASTFTTVDLFVDSGRTPLAAFEVEFKATAGDVKLVGVEGGDDSGFTNPPYYDPAAMTPQGGGRIIISAFNTTEKLPAGKTRVARLHLHINPAGGKPAFATNLIVAGSKEGKPIPATVSFSEGVAR